MRAVVYVLLALFCYASAVTSNSILGVPVKTMLFLGLALCLLAEFCLRHIRCTFDDITLMGALATFLCIWGTLGLLNGYDATIAQHMVKVVTTFGLFILFKLIIDSGYLRANTVIAVLDRMFYLAVFSKLAFEALFVAGVMDGASLAALLRTTFDLDIMPLIIADGLLFRLGAIIDVLPLSIFPFILIRKQGLARYMVLVTISLYALINFSRVYMLQVVVLALLALVPLQTVSRKIKFCLVGVLLLGIIAAIVPNDVYLALTGRFVGIDADASDLTRYVQAEAFLEEIPSALFMGSGLGAYLPGFIRNGDMPFLYELEYLALLFQCGIVGILFIAGLFCLVFRTFNLSQLDRRVRLLMYANILFFIFRPLTNPMLFASNSMMVLVYMFVLSRAQLERN